MPYTLCHIISSLSVGGAQMMLFKLLSRLDRSLFLPEVVSLTEAGELGRKFEELETHLTALGMRRGIPNPQGVWRLTRHLRRRPPQLIQTWMYHADLLGGVAALCAGRPPVIWNIRHSNLDSRIDRKTTLLAAHLCARTSRFLPARIVCCARNAGEAHIRLGYAAHKLQIIPNGFDLDRFVPSASERSAVRQELRIPPDSPVIGLVARYHPMKDHQSFIRAAALLKQSGCAPHFILCGDDVTWENPALSAPITALGLTENFHLLGRRADMPRLTAAFDIAASSSACGEAFSNTIGEAMSCGVPCAVTDVGDAAFIVGDTGLVVPPGAPEQLAEAWQTLVRHGEDYRRALGVRARQRVLAHFSLDTVVGQYQELYLATLRHPTGS